MPKIRTSQIIIFTLGIVAGIFLAILLNKVSNFNIQNDIAIEMNPIEIFSILINILIAYYLTVIFGNKNDFKKSEKDILTRYLEDFRKDKDLIILESIDQILNSQHNNNSHFVNSQFKYLRQKLNMNLTLLVDREILPANSILKQNAESKMRNIWEKITYTPTVNQQNYNIANDLIIARRLSTELDKLLFDLIIIINKK
ncbi:hypothetical protein FCR2A7T_29900 [Flavobacterium cauense R2A-7]|uniref:Uncharacterized protein n=1 Tax=Flavobacterium cauense R2A-7 TaxID=1341154 RepID=V6RV49_9FLAO|nr:hypothetical protein [Flavobacterium cauense]ESU18408.1 hypothetical protein FCR2A7T_29900 [Flavobacterium cauense R2A-7]KGO78682.1 hypothetical protein Q762_15040 [Flavobacterium cauense R2A-7]TWI07377.1 hypothetical protein IP98_02969 [Flavobacterium cauense R2A-7]